MLSEIAVSGVDDYRRAKVSAGKLSATSINKTIQRLGQILDYALEDEFIAQNPVRVNPRRRRINNPPKPPQTYIDRAVHIEALLDAAGELDAKARADQKGTPRKALLATLVLAGVRIGEALDLERRDVDLAAGVLSVRRAKTSAGVRQLKLLPALREELVTLKASTPRGEPGDRVFGAQTGKRQGETNVRRRILAKSVERANEMLSERGHPPLSEGLTPHSLRRTFISLLIALGRDPSFVMQQVGHTDPKVTLGMYSKVMLRDEGEVERLRAVTGESQPNSAKSASPGLSPSIGWSGAETETPLVSSGFD